MAASHSGGAACLTSCFLFAWSWSQRVWIIPWPSGQAHRYLLLPHLGLAREVNRLVRSGVMDGLFMSLGARRKGNVSRQSWDVSYLGLPGYTTQNCPGFTNSMSDFVSFSKTFICRNSKSMLVLSGSCFCASWNQDSVFNKYLYLEYLIQRVMLGKSWRNAEWLWPVGYWAALVHLGQSRPSSTWQAERSSEIWLKSSKETIPCLVVDSTFISMVL